MGGDAAWQVLSVVPKKPPILGLWKARLRIRSSRGKTCSELSVLLNSFEKFIISALSFVRRGLICEVYAHCCLILCWFLKPCLADPWMFGLISRLIQASSINF